MLLKMCLFHNALVGAVFHNNWPSLLYTNWSSGGHSWIHTLQLSTAETNTLFLENSWPLWILKNTFEYCICLLWMGVLWTSKAFSSLHLLKAKDGLISTALVFKIVSPLTSSVAIYAFLLSRRPVPQCQIFMPDSFNKL